MSAKGIAGAVQTEEEAGPTTHVPMPTPRTAHEPSTLAPVVGAEYLTLDAASAPAAITERRTIYRQSVDICGN